MKGDHKSSDCNYTPQVKTNVKQSLTQVTIMVLPVSMQLIYKSWVFEFFLKLKNIK